MSTNYWGSLVKFFGHNGIEFKDGIKIYKLTANPKDTATDAVQGSIGIFENKVFIKQDSGSSTFWLQETSGILALASTGLHDGAVITAGATIGTFDLSTGEATHADSSSYPDVDFHEFTIAARTNEAITDILTQPVTYLLVSELDVLIQQSSFPTPTERRDNLFLGVIVHSDNINVNAVNNEPEVAPNVSSQLHDLMAGLGFFNLSGNVISENGANLSIDKSAGKAFKEGINFNINHKDPHTATLAAQILATFRYRNQDSSEGLDITILDPTTYDNAGVTTTVPANNNSTIQRIYMFPSGGIRVQRGQTVFSNFSDAVNAVGKEPFNVEPNIEENGLLLASIVMKKNATDLTDSSEALIFISSRFGELGSVGSSATTTLQEAYDNSVNPEIVLDTVNGGINIRDNVVPITGNLQTIEDNAGATKYHEVSAERVQITDNDGTHISRKESEVRWIENFKVVAPTDEYTESGGATTGIIANDIVDQLDGYRSAKVTTVAGNQGTRYTSSAKTNLKSVDFQTQGFLFDWQYDQLQGDWNLVIEESTDGITYTENARLELPKQEVSEPATLIFKLNAVAIITHYRHYFEQVGETVGAIARWDNVKVVSRPFNYKEVVETESAVFQGYAAYSTNNTKIPYFTTEKENTISKFGTIINTSADGWAFTALFDCWLDLDASTAASGGTYSGLTINSTELDTSINSLIDDTPIVSFSYQNSSNSGDTIGYNGPIKKGETIRVHLDGAAVSTSIHRVHLSMKVSKTQSQVVFKGKATDTEWTDDGALVPNTGSFGTVPSNKVLYKRSGQDMDVDINVYQNGAGVAGSGVYLFTLPNEASFGSDVVTSTTLTANQSATRIGSGELTTGEGNILANVSMYAYNSTQYWVHMGATVDDAGGSNSSTLDPWGSANRSLGNTIITLKAKLSFPVNGWSVADPMITFPVTNERLNSVMLESNDGRAITANSEDIHFSGNGIGWSSIGDANTYEVQKDGSIVILNTAVMFTGIATRALFIYLNGVEYKTITSLLDENIFAGTYISKAGEFSEGDLLSIRMSTNSGSLNPVTNRHYLNIIENYAATGGFLGNVAPTKHVTSAIGSVGTVYPIPLETVGGKQVYAVAFKNTAQITSSFTMGTMPIGITLLNANNVFGSSSQGISSPYHFISTSDRTYGQMINSTGVISWVLTGRFFEASVTIIKFIYN